ncbi:hypothetical protein OZX38_004299 [Escherichia coli]|uniref:hypothetical protein n=1 Tax=Escherichia coli TaxID=562 RepID=UPI000BDEC1F0|nr:hypothetical protein [Escherichia coli]EKH5790052.1 hypothetical protein [Escherichia coli O8]EFJ6679863.1 hypothetical protein [Escherichia coli]EFJ6710987.1 hypothetical protein [Escherichia coli]EFM2337232.1 hypothetical protein [Escherichia coli]EFS0648561.1 hypothetical protein [Escherichia coli]
MNTYYNNNLLLTLYSFLRQLELSLHRGMDEWETLNNYIRSREVIEVINCLTNDNAIYNLQIKINFISKLILCIFKKGYIKNNEAKKLITLLVSFRDMLHERRPDRNNIINLRGDIYNFASLIRSRIYKDKIRLQMADKIEHYNQSDYGVFYKMEDILSVEWCKPLISIHKI